MLNKTSWVHLASLLAVFVSTFISIATVQAKPLTRSEIGEFFLFGIHDTKVDTKTEKHLTHLCPGSLLLFRRNLVSNQQTAELTKKLRALHATCSKQPLLIGLDQEGGQVARIPFDPPMPSPWAVGVTKDPEIANALGFQVGSTLRQLGFNMNLAPVLDLGHATKKSFIGSRSYGADPELVSKMGAAFSKGLAQAGVLPVAKHFPGIGEVPNDPHQALVRRGSTSQQLWQKDLLPFRKFAEISPSGIMPSHLIYTSTEQAAGPGTFSKTLLQGWLREKIRFNGLIISDDLLMKGAQGNKILNRNVISALQAGVDLIMITWSFKIQEQAVDAVIAALQAGELSESELREKVDRIRKVKQQIGEPKIQTPAPSTQLRLAGSPVYKNLTLQILRKNLARQFLKVDRSRVERIFVWPENPRLRLQLQQALNQKIESAPSQIGKNDLLIAFVRTKSEARRLSSLSPQILSRTLVVNQVEPGILSGSYYQKIEIYLDHPALAWEVGKRLNSRWKPRLAAGR